ncbi:hypothetical protein P5V15_005964 [Pogonomyrmex californicus]
MFAFLAKALLSRGFLSALSLVVTKVTLTIARAPWEGNDSGGGTQGGNRERQRRGWPPTSTYKSQDRPPPGVKRSSTAKTGSSCESLQHLESPRRRYHTGNLPPLPLVRSAS